MFIKGHLLNIGEHVILKIKPVKFEIMKA